ncbi:MAG: response regulator transcription factor [Phaeodactylibacter sp.]|nr:response regulator transcription factor [Phaeodactylibacter sp.]
MLRTIIVEDEKHNRETLKNLLAEFCPEIELVGMAANVEEGVQLIRAEQPDLLFLDIELQTATGFDLLQQVEHLTFDVIFTTAFDQYAIQAIKFSSLDYLLKPIDIDELQQAVQKAVRKNEADLGKAQLELLLSNLNRQQTGQKRICLSTSDGLEFLHVQDIMYCEANGSYTNFVLKEGRKLVVSKHLKGYENLLDGAPFMRVHNKYLINLEEVQRFVKSEGGYILMKNGDHVSISPKKRDEFMERMEQLL